MYYFTLVITPMMLLCGVFFPVKQLPESAQMVAGVLPLTHAIDLARPLMNGAIPRSRVAYHGAAAIRWWVFMCRWYYSGAAV